MVGTFPNPAALLRLTGQVLIEQHDEWDGADRRYLGIGAGFWRDLDEMARLTPTATILSPQQDTPGGDPLERGGLAPWNGVSAGPCPTDSRPPPDD